MYSMRRLLLIGGVSSGFLLRLEVRQLLLRRRGKAAAVLEGEKRQTWWHAPGGRQLDIDAKPPSMLTGFRNSGRGSPWERCIPYTALMIHDHFLIVYSQSHVAATLNAKVKENGEASPKPHHPDLKYLDQILTVPKRDLFVEVDNDEEWLYGPLGVKLRKARTWMTMVALVMICQE
ncbi:hypothetical protein Rs2_15901 [Raphanus sativus]|nr:hypothetical protein Rs2_15901 [Raphanus sativus]